VKKGLKHAQKETARERVDELFTQASKSPKYAKRYVSLARRMSARYRVRIPKKWRRRFCKACNTFLTPGKNCTVRKRNLRIVITCLECNSVKRVST